jgi:hypothetical protein
MRTLLLSILIALMIPGQASAQEMRTAGGRVLDEASGNGLQFVQIALGRSGIGTVSNEDGQFMLLIPPAFAADSLFFSCLGYGLGAVPVKDLWGRENVIRLKPKEILLREVEVISLSPEEVLRRAFDSISSNYGRDSVLLTAFYRSRKYHGRDLAEYAEAVIEDLKTGYLTQHSARDSRRTKEVSNLTMLVKGRVVSDTARVNSMGEVGQLAGCLGCIFSHDPAESNFGSILDRDIYQDYALKMEELANPSGGKIYHLYYEQKSEDIKGFKGEIFIDGSSFALMRITQKPSFKAYSKFEKDKYKRTYTIGGIPGWIAEMPLLNRNITYDKRDGLWNLGTVQEEQWVTFTHPATGKKLRMGYKNELVVTGVARDPAVIRDFRGEKKTGSDLRWDQLAGSGDEAFWMNFNYLPLEESLKNAITQIGK